MISTVIRSDNELSSHIMGGTPRFLLTRPDAFSVTYAINPFMNANATVNRSLALQQWENLCSNLEQAGAHLEIQAAVDECPDLVFSNNAALVLDNRALLSRFRHAERRAESPHNRTMLESIGISVTELPPAVIAFEGAACAMPYRGSIICAYGSRTTRDAIAHVGEFANLPIVPVELPDLRFYHLDITFCILNADTAMVVPEAMTAASYQRIRALVPNLLELTLEEGLQFCANAVVVDHTVFMHSVPQRVGALLEDHGFDAVEIPVTEFIKSGGSLACMALRLDRTAHVHASSHS